LIGQRVQDIAHVISGIISWIRWQHVAPEIRTISAFKVTTYGVSSIAQKEEFENAGFVSRMEADTHADTTVTGKNQGKIGRFGKSH
jgi:hypothetical protein